jgi:hypothetical protein
MLFDVHFDAALSEMVGPIHAAFSKTWILYSIKFLAKMIQPAVRKITKKTLEHFVHVFRHVHDHCKLTFFAVFQLHFVFHQWNCMTVQSSSQMDSNPSRQIWSDWCLIRKVIYQKSEESLKIQKTYQIKLCYCNQQPCIWFPEHLERSNRLRGMPTLVLEHNLCNGCGTPAAYSVVHFLPSFLSFDLFGVQKND